MIYFDGAIPESKRVTRLKRLEKHRQTLEAFTKKSANAELTKRLADATNFGVQLNACGNTMRAMSLELADLLPGFVRFDQGGVVRLTELQMQGYSYLRP